MFYLEIIYVIICVVIIMINYDKELEKLISNLNGTIPKLLLHSCCAPCSSYVISYLTNYFDISIFYYNPNISPKDEYIKRKKEQIRLINSIPTKNKLDIIDCDYENDIYEKMIKGLENEPERGNRCTVCFKLRLDTTCRKAKELGYDYFGTTLTVSPYKNSNLINEIGLSLQDKYNIKYLISDFKKREGYKKSIELSKKYDLYRQDFCGCKYSKKAKLFD
ncbi:MAG: epoxyqueuosine reductase QueH [Bacilli bacterium]|nr:epoxyqueuosine reductase QueH [Bacilli bacterium]